jgi:high affinity Mn2+ porin
MKKQLLGLLVICCLKGWGQTFDSTKVEQFSVHFQATIINQIKPGFKVPYSGNNSLSPNQESQTSITSTLFLGSRLWKGSSLFFNPEIAGGSGLSSALGVAASTNGETFRVGSPSPVVYLARLFLRQEFNLSNETTFQDADFNKFRGPIHKKYLAITIGKVGVNDYFDFNSYSHDPREHFMSWALMSNGAWDYPANVRGYTPSLILEYFTHRYEVRYGISLMAKTANGNTMDWNILNSSSQTLELVRKHQLNGRTGVVRLLGFFTRARMGNYQQSIALRPFDPIIEDTRKIGNTKYGFGLNIEQQLSEVIGMFLRASWNDGTNETWAFTEIDRSLSGGLEFKGRKWKRPNDYVGVAYALSGLSKPHRNYLKAGGKGFMLGDGNLAYATEHLIETFYCANLISQNLFISAAYQLVINPGYNADRKGPVNVFSVRLHVRI